MSLKGIDRLAGIDKGIVALGNSLKGKELTDIMLLLNKSDDIAELTDIFKVMGAGDDIIAQVLHLKNLDGSIDDVTDSVHEFTKAGKGLDGVKAVFKGIGGVIKSIAPAIGNDTVLSGTKISLTRFFLWDLFQCPNIQLAYVQDTPFL